MPADIVLKNRQLRLLGPLGMEKMVLLRADVEEVMSELGKADIQFLSHDHNLALDEIVGQRLTLEVDDPAGNTRYFQGYCSNCAYEGDYAGQALYRAEMRPTLWFLTLGYNSRIFQEKSALDVIKDVLRDAGLTDFEDKTTATYTARDYIVQYRESDFDFVSRLMEEEGIYYFFTHNNSTEKMVLADSSSAHTALVNAAEVPFFFREAAGYDRAAEHIFDWKSAETVNAGKFTFTDYNFLTSTSDLKAVTAIPKGSHHFKDIDYYDYPGHQLTADEGGTRSRVRMEAIAAQHNRSRGKGNVRTMTVGGTFTLQNHPRSSFNKEYLVLSAHHKLRIETDTKDDDQAASNITSGSSALGAPGTGSSGQQDGMTLAAESEFTVQLKSEPYRTPSKTPLPKIPGLQTAVVTGPSGEEIYTDEHGRIKVQFHWDRDGAKDEQTTCFIRVMQHISGQGWGAFHIPRIGQEVVVQFEEGNPDRPIVVGMLYNDAKKHPFDFPANMTQSGVKTNSSKGGGGFHELVFEDKKDEEFIRFQSEKDYFETIKNNAEINIGFEKMDPGDLTQKVYNNMTEEVDQGDHTFKVNTGNQIIEIATDRTETVGGNETISIGGDRTEDVGGGDTVTIGGDRTEDVGGSETLTVGGDVTWDVGGSVSITAGSTITLTVGGSSIEISSSSITISTTSVSIEGSGSVDVAGASTTVDGSGSLDLTSGGVNTISGSVVKIN